jgi:hypothetical protein
MDPWKDLASKGVRFVSFGSYNKIWKSSGVVSFYSKEKTFDEEEVIIGRGNQRCSFALEILKRDKGRKQKTQSMKVRRSIKP